MTDNPYIRRREQHRIGKPGRKSESRLAKALVGRQRPASGAMAGAKGDIGLSSFLIECKSTTRDSMTLKLDWLAKIGREARSEGKTPALTVSFIREDGSFRVDGEFILVPMHLFSDLFGEG